MPLHVSSTCAHHHDHTYRCDDTRGCFLQFWPPDDEHICSKHVEAWNKLIVKQTFCASSWLITEINILICTVSKTSKYTRLFFVNFSFRKVLHEVMIYGMNLFITYLIITYRLSVTFAYNITAFTVPLITQALLLCSNWQKPFKNCFWMYINAGFSLLQERRLKVWLHQHNGIWT